MGELHRPALAFYCQTGVCFWHLSSMHSSQTEELAGVEDCVHGRGQLQKLCWLCNVTLSPHTNQDFCPQIFLHWSEAPATCNNSYKPCRMQHFHGLAAHLTTLHLQVNRDALRDRTLWAAGWIQMAVVKDSQATTQLGTGAPCRTCSGRGRVACKQCLRAPSATPLIQL